MLRRNVRDRPAMKWRVMDMTSMQFSDETFDIVLDKGGLDALMEPEHGFKLGDQYLSEVKRVLISGGKFICLTLAESHVLGLLFSKLRFGWIISIHAIPHKSCEKSSLQTFMVIALKGSPAVVQAITSSFNRSLLDCNSNQISAMFKELDNENSIREEYLTGSDVLHSLEDLRLGAKGALDKLNPGRRVQLILSSQSSRYSFRAVLLDAQEQSKTYLRHCGVIIVPKARAHGWLYSSEEGQWKVVESAEAARLIMVFLDSSHMHASMDDIQKDLSPLVKQLEPANNHGSQIPFMMVDDPIKDRELVHQVTSSLTGRITIEDVVFSNVEGDVSHILPDGDLTFRRMIFQRNEDLVQSEALLTREGSTVKSSGRTDRRKVSSSKSRKRGNQRKTNEPQDNLKISHDYLASSYHSGILSGFMLVSSYLEKMSSTGRTVRAVVIGLGAGLLPMFLHGTIPSMHVEVVELDSLVLNLAREYFDFIENDRMKVHITDGIEFVRRVASTIAPAGAAVIDGKENGNLRTLQSPDSESLLDSQNGSEIDILVVDVDSEDPSSGLSCPAADFVEEPFLRDAKSSISKQGLFVVNLVSRSTKIKEMVISRLKTVFNHLYSLQLEEDVNEILFALKTDDGITDNQFTEAADQLQKLLLCRHPKMRQTIVDTCKKITRLK
ncbi:Methyltransf_11 domain-containing protein [Psidium guajava]|nr:Methyltransf_11 domain-containing protein [Psidium guajava]